jgi:hypothetical protein
MEKLFSFGVFQVIEKLFFLGVFKVIDEKSRIRIR